MNLSKVMLFVSFPLISSISSEIVDCIKASLQEDKSLLQNFSEQEISRHCEIEAELEDIAESIYPLDEPVIAETRAQRDWLNSLSLCREKSCISEIVRENRKDAVLRKEIRMLNATEREKWHRAVRKLKNETIDGVSKYDLFVKLHMKRLSPEAHASPAFLPFHRELLKQFELALRQIDADVSIPYWDSILDEGLPNPSDSVLWTDEFFGNSKGTVVTGPYKWWNVTEESCKFMSHNLIRDSGVVIRQLISPVLINFVKSRANFSQLTFCVDKTLELAHRRVHDFVGGHMDNISTAANDPIFFMHHAFMDKLWEDFRIQSQTPIERESQYPSPEKGRPDCTKPYHNALSRLRPFLGLRILDGLSNIYTRDFYKYDDLPSCDKTQPHCHSSFLFCDVSEYRCVSKIRVGGDCSNLQEPAACFQSKCVQGRCLSIVESGIEGDI